MVNYDFVYDGTELAVAEMIKSGTTCFADQYFFCEAAAEVVKKTGMRACLGIPILGTRRRGAGGRPCAARLTARACPCVPRARPRRLPHPARQDV